jgi:hypothetical protein
MEDLETKNCCKRSETLIVFSDASYRVGVTVSWVKYVFAFDLVDILEWDLGEWGTDLKTGLSIKLQI